MPIGVILNTLSNVLTPAESVKLISFIISSSSSSSSSIDSLFIWICGTDTLQRIKGLKN